MERIIENEVFRDEIIEIDEQDIHKYRDQAFKILPTQVDVYEQDVIKEIKKSQKNYIEKIIEVPVE